jgi:hypothetical protein
LPLTLAFWLGISLFMHGRLVYVFLGMTVILLAQLQQLRTTPTANIKAILLQIFGLFLCVVTSGTLLIAFLQILSFQLIFILLSGRLFTRRNMLYLMLLLVGLLGLGAASSLPDLIVNTLSYYHFSFSGVLTHGPFGLLPAYGVPLSYLPIIYGLYAALVLVLIVRFHRMIAIKLPQALPFLTLIALASIIGMMGYSTLLAALPALLVVAIRYGQKIGGYLLGWGENP